MGIFLVKINFNYGRYNRKNYRGVADKKWNI